MALSRLRLKYPPTARLCENGFESFPLAQAFTPDYERSDSCSPFRGDLSGIVRRYIDEPYEMGRKEEQDHRSPSVKALNKKKAPLELKDEPKRYALFMTSYQDLDYCWDEMKRLQQRGAFLVRFDSDVDVEGGRIEGKVEHVASYESRRFHSLNELLLFFDRVLTRVRSELKEFS